MGRSSVQKRISAPKAYHIPRKPRHGRFVTRTGPGPHPRRLSYDPITLLRDVLKLVGDGAEARYVMKRGNLIVDGVVRRDVRFPIGLMDVVEIQAEDLVYRMVPKGRLPIHPVQISDREKDLKLIRIKGKTTVKRGLTQLVGHDGRSFLVEDPHKYKVGDSLLIRVPGSEILDHIPLEEGSSVLIIGGSRVSYMGKVVEVLPGSFNVKPSIRIEMEGEEEVIVPRDLVMPVGKPEPPITVRG